MKEWQQRSEHPVEFYLHQHLSPATREYFDLRFNEKDSPASATSAHSCADTFTTLNLTSSTYVQLYQHVMHTPLPHSGHGRQRFEFVDDETSQVEECELDSSPDNDDQNEHQPVSVAALKKILMQALAWFFLHKSMSNMSETAYICLDQIPFMLSLSVDLFNPIMFYPSDEQKTHEEHLDELLKSWQYLRQKVLPDGNCLFHSVAFNIKTQLERENSELEQIVSKIGINVQESLTQIASGLRKCVVKEWLGEQSQSYQVFMSEGQLQSQAEEFLQDGAYSLDIGGDLAIAALTNMLQTPLILFTSRPNQPLHIQYPTHSPMLNLNPICLAYLQFGPGHYDAVAPISVEQEKDIIFPAAAPPMIHCNCARKSTKSNACSFSLTQYTCRCPCYNSKHPCTEYCKCKGCTNTFGVKPTAKATKAGQKRKRPAHESQCVPLQGKRTVKFMEAVGEPVSIGGFSKMEYLLTASIVQSPMSDT